MLEDERTNRSLAENFMNFELEQKRLAAERNLELERIAEAAQKELLEPYHVRHHSPKKNILSKKNTISRIFESTVLKFLAAHVKYEQAIMKVSKNSNVNLPLIESDIDDIVRQCRVLFFNLN
jgi:hypothetical protein